MGLLGLAIVTFIFTVFTGPEKAIDNAFAVKLPYVVAARDQPPLGDPDGMLVQRGRRRRSFRAWTAGWH